MRGNFIPNSYGFWVVLLFWKIHLGMSPSVRLSLLWNIWPNFAANENTSELVGSLVFKTAFIKSANFCVILKQKHPVCLEIAQNMLLKLYNVRREVPGEHEISGVKLLVLQGWAFDSYYFF